MKKLLTLIFLPFFAFAGITWTLPPENIFQVSGEDGIYPNVDIDQNGNAVAAWVRTLAGGAGVPVVQTRFRPAPVGGSQGGPWGPIMTLSDGANPGHPASVTTPAIAIDKNGNAVAAWSAFNGSFYVIQAAVRSFSTGIWSAVNPAISSASANAGDVVAAWDNDGNAVIVWSVFGGAIQSTTLGVANAQPTSAIVTVSSPTAVTPGVGNLISKNDNGDILVAWLNNTPSKTMQVAIRPTGGAWTAPQTVSPASDVVLEFSAAIDGQKNVYAVWNKARTGTNSALYSSQNFWPSTTWPATGTAVSLFADLSGANPQIAVDPKGNGSLFWFENNPSVGVNEVAVIATKSKMATDWSAYTIVSPVADEAEGCAHIVADTINDVVAIWNVDSIPGNLTGAIQSQSKSSGENFPAQTPINLSTGNSPTGCALAINGNGMAVSVWGSTMSSGVVQATVGFFGVANPNGLTLEQKPNDFALVTEYYNVLKWNSSPSAGIVSYNIFSNGSLIASVGSATTTFEAHDQLKGAPVTYTIVAVNAFGQQSTGVSISLE